MLILKWSEAEKTKSGELEASKENHLLILTFVLYCYFNENEMSVTSILIRGEIDFTSAVEDIAFRLRSDSEDRFITADSFEIIGWILYAING